MQEQEIPKNGAIDYNEGFAAAAAAAAAPATID
jgi:hypothetical protein